MTTEDTPALPNMPAEIAAAIAEVKGNIEKLIRDGTNSFQKYSYSSVDAFYELIGPLEAAAGLSVVMTEAEPPEIVTMAKADREGAAGWLKIRWAITICHSSGQSYGPIHRTVMVPASGAQAFGSAESYISKQFARCLYRIATGDKDDVDAEPKHPLPASRRPQGQRPPERRATEAQPEAKPHNFNPTAPKQEKAKAAQFSWKTATPDARAKFVLDNIAAASLIPDPVQSMERLAAIGKGVTESAVGKDNYTRIQRALTAAENANKPGENGDTVFTAELDAYLTMLTQCLSEATTLARVEKLTESWTADQGNVSPEVYQQGVTLLAEARKRLTP